MDRLVIDTEMLKNAAERFSGANASLANVYRETLKVLVSVRSAAPGQENVICSVSSLSSRINSATVRSGLLSGSCRTVAEMWEKCERSIAGYSLLSNGSNTVKPVTYTDACALDTAFDADAYILANSFSTIVGLAEETCKIDISVFDPNAIEHVYYLLMNESYGHSAILLVDKNGNAMHYCFYNSGDIGIRFMPAIEVTRFKENGEILDQVSSKERFVRYPNTYDLMLDCNDITDSKEVYRRCLDNWLTSKKGGIEYNLLFNNCDDLAYDALFDKRSPSPIPNKTYESLKEAVVEATGEDKTLFVSNTAKENKTQRGSSSSGHD